MRKAFIPRSLRNLAAFALAGAFSLSAQAFQTFPPESKPAAEGCHNKIWIQPVQNPTTAHKYMFMMVFKAGTGKQYFGNATYDRTGCLAVPPAMTTAAKAGAKAGTKPATDEEVYPAEICPSDCSDPPGEPPFLARAKGKPAAKAKAKAAGAYQLDKGTDPLGELNWGVLSALETPLNTEVVGNTFEIWQVKVTDACMAKALYAYYSQEGQFLATARKSGDFMGQMMIGYRTAAAGKSDPC